MGELEDEVLTGYDKYYVYTVNNGTSSFRYVDKVVFTFDKVKVTKTDGTTTVFNWNNVAAVEAINE